MDIEFIKAIFTTIISAQDNYKMPLTKYNAPISKTFGVQS